MCNLTERNKIQQALLVESDCNLQALQQSVLAGLGFQVTLAVDDRVATGFLATRVFDLIIIHDAFPAVNALLLMKIIHHSAQSYRNKNARVCLAYAKGELIDELKALFWGHGFRHFLTVPLTTEALRLVWCEREGDS